MKAPEHPPVTLAEMEAELDRLAREYAAYTAPLAWAKAEAGIDPTDEQQAWIAANRTRAAELHRRVEPLQAQARSRPPTRFAYSSRALPAEAEHTIVWTAEGGLSSSRQERDGPAETRTRAPGGEEWGLFFEIIDKLRAPAWRPFYGARMFDGHHFSLAIERGPTRVATRGENAYPPGFEVLWRAIEGLLDGTLASVRSELLRGAALAASAQDDPASAVPRLARALGGEDVEVAARALATFKLDGMPALPALIASTAPDRLAVRDAVDVLREEIERARPADRRRHLLPVLSSILDALILATGTAELRGALTSMLRYLGPVDARILPTLVAVLRDPEPAAATAAVRALAALGGDAVDAVPGLVAALRDRIAEPQLSEEIARALVAVDPAAARLGASIVADALKESSPRALAAALAATAILGPATAVALPLLIPLARGSGGDLRWRAIVALGAIGSAARAAEPALAEAARAGEAVVRWRALDALGKIDPVDAASWSALVAGLDDRDAQVREAAARALCRLPARAELVAPLTALLRSPRAARWSAMVLGQLGRLASAATPDLVQALASADQWTRLEGARALGRMGSVARAAIPALLEALRDPEGLVRVAAAQALESIGGGSRQTSIATLLGALTQAEAQVRRSAAKALEEMGPAAAAAVPALIEALNDQELRIHAARALGAIGPAARPAVPRLQMLLATSPGFEDQSLAEALQALDATPFRA